MKCENCGEREAGVHFTQIRNNRKSEMHLCKECAKSKGFHNPLDDVPFPLAEFLTSMVQRGASPSDPIARLVCPECGMRSMDFSRLGRFGCGQCYTAFRAPLEDLFRKVHGATRHRGRTPQPTGRPQQTPIEEEVRLKEDLRKAIEREDFELAAELRDRLRTHKDEGERRTAAAGD
ncbi:MAG: UvrB/UvrC motif-containing protein [candidate division Zixibacteria bacterium]|nr:UvrB/UvrC motif-containing protein [candidate division Zixibacteria bacterium]